MDNNRQDRPDTGNDRDLTTNRLEQRSSVPNDLPDNEHDKDRLNTEETFIEIPDVKDIPGQEFVNAPPLRGISDTTISSEDEEGTGVFDKDDSEDFNEWTRFDVRPDERAALEDETYLPTNDEDQLRRARMDNVDFQGEALNEGSFGVNQEEDAADLDIPDEGDETRTTSMGQGDEENKYYSLGSADNDNVTEGTP
jgi:hypothetical protein